MSKKEHEESTLKSGRERSLENLKKGKPFTSVTGAINGPKAAKAKSENCKYRKATEASLLNLINKGALNDLTKDFKNLKTMEKIAVLEHLRDSSGQKPKDAPEAIVMPVINIKGL